MARPASRFQVQAYAQTQVTTSQIQPLCLSVQGLNVSVSKMNRGVTQGHEDKDRIDEEQDHKTGTTTTTIGRMQNNADSRLSVELSNAIQDQVQYKNLDALRQIVKTPNFDINQLDNRGYTPLMQVVNKNWVEGIKFLIENSQDLKLDLNCTADTNGDAFDGETAIMLAAYYGQVDSVKLLVDAGADLNIRNKNGCDALYYAQLEADDSQSKILEIIQYLVASKRLDLDHVNNFKTSALSKIVEDCGLSDDQCDEHNQMIRTLVKGGATYESRINQLKQKKHSEYYRQQSPSRLEKLERKIKKQERINDVLLQASDSDCFDNIFKSITSPPQNLLSIKLGRIGLPIKHKAAWL